MIALYMDVHVHNAITRGVRRRGVDVITAQEDGSARLDDSLLLDRAASLNRLLFTQDEDFLIEANYRQTEGIDFIGVIYIHQRDTIIGRCITDLETIAYASKLEEYANLVRHLPL